MLVVMEAVVRGLRQTEERTQGAKLWQSCLLKSADWQSETAA